MDNDRQILVVVVDGVPVGLLAAGARALPDSALHPVHVVCGVRASPGLHVPRQVRARAVSSNGLSLLTVYRLAPDPIVDY